MSAINPAAALFNKYAEKYMQQYMDVSMYAESLDRFIALLLPSANVLELGCGPANITKYLLSGRPDLRILGTDLAPAMIELAKNNVPHARFMVLDARNVRMVDESYDAVVCGFVLPYLDKEDAAALLADISKKLHAGGHLYLSFIAGEYETSGIQTSSGGDTLMQYYYSTPLMHRLLATAGFGVLHTYSVTYPGRDGKTVEDLVFIAEKI